ncbi:quinate pathway repressor protein [Phlyctema vagabunda]|uniref:Quinate pathway repressor protein n=1 Tax=Phlyctema vagabunda TaxID=108571 RepID=A0ABR4PTV4_9HELO
MIFQNNEMGPKDHNQQTPPLPNFDSDPRVQLRTHEKTKSRKLFSPDASIVLIGIRGSGKRSLGFIAATALGWRFITEDHYFEAVTGTSRAAYLQQHGHDDFRRKDGEVVRLMLERHKTRCVIECGLGSLVMDAKAYLREFCKTNPVVHVRRRMDRIQQLLRLSDDQARLMEHSDLGHPFCSNFEYYNLYDQNCERYREDGAQDPRLQAFPFKLKATKEDFLAFIRTIAGPANPPNSLLQHISVTTTPVELREYTHAVRVRYSEIVNGSVEIRELESSEDAIEYIVDVFNESSISVISKHVATIRRLVGVPVMFSVEGEPKNNRSIRFGLLLHALRLAVDFLIVDVDDEDYRLSKLIEAKGPTKVIGNFVDANPAVGAWTSRGRYARYQAAEQMGCDMVRISQPALSSSDNEDVADFRKRVKALPGLHLPLIAYNSGREGFESLITNHVLTPVRRPRALPGNMFSQEEMITAREAMQELYTRGVLQPLHFYLFGEGISHSLAAFMHNAAYEICGLNFDYEIRETTALGDLHAASRDPHFGGCSISHPFKVSVYHNLADMSHRAQAIGAVNTLLPLRASPDGKPDTLGDQLSHRGRVGPVAGWYGDNTDWIGMTTCIQRNLSPRNVIQPTKTTGLVLGAGGMARAAVYSLLQLRCRRVYIYNRSPSNAQNVADHFNSWLSKQGRLEQDLDALQQKQEKLEQKVEVLQSKQESWPSSHSLPTMVISCVPAHSIDGRPSSDYELPAQWLSSSTGGVLLDMAYKPLNTPLLQQVRRLRAETGQAWVPVDGLEMVPEQGIAQFELMTGRKAPRGQMRAAIKRRYQDSETV